ncbi:MAG: SLBB domain-containing protein [Verrucomicrobiales bacterium]|nr:SLBB domain-containing protein [Verrucomicrobiales bacterium]
MKSLLTALILIAFQFISLNAQEHRLRVNQPSIPGPAEYWEELEPVPLAVAEKIHPVEKRISPAGVPAWQTRYTLGAGDILNFSVYNRPDLLREKVQIAPDGTVSYLQAVAVRAEGLTLDQLRNRLEEVLAEHQELKVIVTPVEVASKDFAIIGRVRKPGTYTLDRPTSILEAIARAEGMQVGNVRGSAFELADLERSFVARKGKKLNVDLARLYFEGDFSQNAFLEPDDYIYVASALENEIYVLGEVNNPGRRKMPARLTLAQAIGEAGGFAQYAFRKKILLIRGSIHAPETQIVDMRAILTGEALDVKLQNRDIIFVNKRPFELVERALDDAIFTFVQTVTAEAMNQNYVPISLGN